MVLRDRLGGEINSLLLECINAMSFSIDKREMDNEREYRLLFIAAREYPTLYLETAEEPGDFIALSIHLTIRIPRLSWCMVRYPRKYAFS